MSDGGTSGRRPAQGRWTLRRRVGLLMTALALVTVAIGVWIGWQTWDSRAAVLHEQQSVQPASANVEALLAAFVNQEAGVRGYALTGDASYLGPYAAASVQSRRLLGTLRSELAGHTAALAALATVADRHAVWVQEVARPEIADVRAGRMTAASTAVATDGGQQDIERLWSAMQGLQVQVADLTQQANAAVDGTLSRTFTLVVVRAAVLLLLMAGSLILLRRWINEPVEQLAGEIRLMAEGDLDRPVETQGPPELADLGRDVEEMRRRLRDEADELRQLRQALAEHSPLQVMLHSELEPVASVPDFAARLLPAEGVLAGDWYDVWDRGPDGMAAALVDVSGHGPVAGLFALKIKHLLSPPMRAGASPGEALALATAEGGDTDEQFATGIVVELGRGVLRYANAGHPSGLLFRGDDVEHLSPTGPLMYALPGSWRTEEVPVGPGDLLVLITDGVAEARLPDGSEFGAEGVVRVVGRQGRAASPDQVAESIVSALREQCRMPLKDDATVVVIRATAQ